MNKLELKQKIIEAGKAKMQGIVNDYNLRIKELNTNTKSSGINESASQTDSRAGAELELLGSLSKQLDFAALELEILTRIDTNKVHDKIDFGSVVITNKRNLFVSTGIEEFKVDSKTYFGLSTRAPLYKNIAGCMAGDCVSFHGIEYQIQEIF